MFKSYNITVREMDVLEHYTKLLPVHPSLYNFVEICVIIWMKYVDSEV